MNRKVKWQFWDREYNRFFISSNGETDIVMNDDGNVFVLCNENGDLYLTHFEDRFIKRCWIGLKDEDNVDIYEGDVVSDIYGTHVVEWNDDKCKWQRSDNGHDINDNKYYGISRRVIGNIYENPELLSE